MQEIIWPESIKDCLLPEHCFAEAYEALQPLAKARLKQGIASIFAWYGASNVSQELQTLHWEQGFYSQSLKRPRPWVFILVGPDIHASGPLLAAVLPALLAQAGEVFVFSSRQQENWPAEQICGLELAGVELVGSADQDLQQKLVHDLEGLNGPGLVLVLKQGRGSLVLDQAQELKSSFLVLHVPAQAGLWTDTGKEWDFQTLNQAHPDLELKVCSLQAQPELPPGISLHITDPEQFLHQGHNMLLVPEHMQGSALEHADLVLCPGQEYCWIWPGLERSLFLRSGLALSSL